MSRQKSYAQNNIAKLRSLVPIERGVPTFRGLRTPATGDLSLLARCIRFAKSRAEEHACWAVHPKHIMLICEYTNNDGISPDRDEFKGEQPGRSGFGWSMLYTSVGRSTSLPD